MPDILYALFIFVIILCLILGLIGLAAKHGVIPLKSLDELSRQQRRMVGLKGFPYRKKAQVLSLAEERFAQALLEAIGEDYFPMCKVRLADVLDVTVQGKNFYPAFNPIAQKHIDFLLCDGESSAPLLAIELDDRSHGGKRAQERDAFKSKALEAAELPLLRIPAAAEYDPEVLKRRIDAAIGVVCTNSAP